MTFKTLIILVDVWRSCAALDEFCSRRPFHHDCTPKTAWGFDRCVCWEIYGSLDCAYTSDLTAPDITYDEVPCLQPGLEACEK